MRKYIQRSILKGETRPSYKIVAPTLVCSTPIKVVANAAVIPTFDFNNAPPAFTLILEEDSFGFIASHSIIINNSSVAHIKSRIESVTKISNGQPRPIFSVDTVSAFITISAPNASFLRVLPFDGADYEESAHVHLGLIPDPDPRGTSYVSDFNLRSATSLDNKTSVLTSYIAPYEDRTSESVNRAIDSVANNVENTYLAVDDVSYKVVQIKVNNDIGNDELVSYIQDSNFVDDAIVPVMHKPQNAAWVRSVKQEVIEQEFGKFPDGKSKLEIRVYATNKPIYIASKLENINDLPRVSSFSEIYLASRERAKLIEENDPIGHAGFSHCSNTTKISTNKDILLGNESSYEAFIKSGKVDDVFGNDVKISNPCTFWIASADISQQNLDDVYVEVLKASEENLGVSADKQFTAQKKVGWVSFPGTLYGTKAMSGLFECLDRGTIRYKADDQEKLPVYISAGMLLTNNLDAYEIEQVVDQKTLLLKPINNYEDILLGDVSLLQRTELRPGLVQNFDIYFGKCLSKTQIAVFATKAISVESILYSQRENDNIAPERILPDEVLDIGLLVRINNTRLGTSKDDNLGDYFTNEETLGNIDKRLALFNKFIRSAIGANLTADNSASPISLESLADNASNTRSPFKSSAHYISQPLVPSIQDEGYITVPQVLALNLLRKNSTRQSFISAAQVNYAFKTFEADLIKGVKLFCNLCFLDHELNIGNFNRLTWASLVKVIETGDSNAIFAKMVEVQLNNFLTVSLNDLHNNDDKAFKDFVSLVYSSLKYYGYGSILSVISKKKFDILAPDNIIQNALFNTVRQQYVDVMNEFGNATCIGSNIFKLRQNNDSLAEFFSIEDVGKPFTLSYLHISSQNTNLPYIKQIRVFMDEWYNGSCVRLSFDGMRHNDVEGILSNPCFISYAPGDMDEIADITEALVAGSTKAQILDSFSSDMTLCKIFASPTTFRVANTYFMERSFSNLIISDEYTYIIMPGINAFDNDCEALSLLPKFIGGYINLDLATMTYDLARTANLDPANVTTSQEFLNNFIKPFFQVIGAGNGPIQIIPNQDMGVYSVFLDIKMANPRGQTINRLVECTRTCVAYDGTIMLRVGTNSLMTNDDRDLFLSRFPVNNLLTQKINAPTQFNGYDANEFEINYPGFNNISQFYVDTMPMRRNLLALSAAYAFTQWFIVRSINVINHKQQASVNILSLCNVQASDVNTKVITDNQYIQKKATDSRILIDIRPNLSSFKANTANNKHTEIESFNDSTAVSILQKTSIAQGKNRTEFQEQQGQDNDINSGLQVKTEPRSFNEQSLEKAVNHPTLRSNEQSTVFLFKTRQAGVHGISLVNTHSVTPAILGVITNEDGAPTNEDADNFSIGAVTAINKLDNQVFAQSTCRPNNASLQTNQNVIMDDSIIYEGSDNIISGNARTNWKGTGFKRLGGRATSLNTVTSARQPDVHEASYSSLVSPHYKRSAKKFFRYVDSRKASQSAKGRGFSSGSINLNVDRSQNFKDVKNVGINYANLPNYMGENDILFSYLKNTPINYFIDDSERGLFTVIALFEGTSNLHTFSRFADSYRTVSIRIIFAKNPNSALKDLEGSGFATGVIPSALETADIDFENDNVYASGFLLDSLITDDMITAYQEKYGLSYTEAYESLKDHALGLNEPELNWMALSGTKVQVLLHGREWNANIHALNVSGELSIGNNFKDRTLEIIVDKERESALISVPNGSLSISVDNTLNIDAQSVEGSGLVDIQKKVLNTQTLNLPMTKTVRLMMLPIRPAITFTTPGKTIDGSKLDEVMNTQLFSIQASSYVLHNIDQLIVPPYSPPGPVLVGGNGTAGISNIEAATATVQQNHRNILNFDEAFDSCEIYRSDVMLGMPNTNINVLNDVNTCKPRHELDLYSLFPHYPDNNFLNVAKKYFIVDLHDYISMDADPSIDFIKTYHSFDVRDQNNVNDTTSDINAVQKNDILNSYQSGDSDSFFNYEGMIKATRVSGSNSPPVGIIRSFTTEDGVFSTNLNLRVDPLNIVKLEAKALYNQPPISQLRPHVECFTEDNSPFYSINSFEDYGTALHSTGAYKEDMDIQRVPRTQSTIARVVISRYNARAYIYPILDESNKIIYVIQFAGPEIVFTVKLHTFTENGYVYPVSDFNMTNDGQYTLSENGNPIKLLKDYERSGTNNIISESITDVDGNKAFFTRPLITWINYSATVDSQNASTLGRVIAVTFQPAHYMPLWQSRDAENFTSNLRGDIAHVEKVQYASAFIFTSLYKLFRGCTEVLVNSGQTDLKPISIDVGNAYVSNKSYAAELTPDSFDIRNTLEVYYDANNPLWGGLTSPPEQSLRRRAKQITNIDSLSLTNQSNIIKEYNALQIYHAFPKKIIRVQGKSKLTKIKYSIDDFSVDEYVPVYNSLTEFTSLNRSYYNLINRIDFLEHGPLRALRDSVFLQLDNLEGFSTHGLLNNFLLPDATKLMQEYTATSFSLSEFIKSFLSITVEAHRVFRMRNAGLANMASEMNSNSPNLQKIMTDANLSQVNLPADPLDPRLCCGISTIKIPYVLSFDRK